MGVGAGSWGAVCGFWRDGGHVQGSSAPSSTVLQGTHAWGHCWAVCMFPGRLACVEASVKPAWEVM